tara:strand:- start:125 stop:316 length:192 start_codon:yes stop_codon:yes gene_type:complete
MNIFETLYNFIFKPEAIPIQYTTEYYVVDKKDKRILADVFLMRSAKVELKGNFVPNSIATIVK